MQASSAPFLAFASLLALLAIGCKTSSKIAQPSPARVIFGMAEGDSLLGRHDYTAALRAYEQGAAKYIAAGDTLNLDLATLYHQIGYCQIRSGNPRASIGSNERALSIKEANGKGESPLAAESYNSLHAAYFDLQIFDSSTYYCRKALGIRQKAFGLYSDEVAASMVNLGNCCLRSEKIDSAKICYEQSIAIWDSIFGKLCRAKSNPLSNLGLIAQYYGDYPRAIAYFKEAIAITTATVGSEAIENDAAWMNLAVTYNAMGEPDSAIHYTQKSIRVVLPILGDDHPRMAELYANLGNFLGQKGNVRRAMELLLKSERIFIQKFGPDCSSLPLVYSLISNLQPSPKIALNYLKKALYIIKKSRGEQDGELVIVYNNIAENYAANEDYESAIKHSKKAISIAKLQYKGDDHPVFSVLYGNAGNYSMFKGDWEPALDYYQKSIACRIVHSDAGFHNLQPIYLNIGNLYAEKKDSDEALRWFARCDSSYRYGTETSVQEKSALAIGIGIAYMLKKEFPAALRHFDEAAAVTGYTGDIRAVQNSTDLFYALSGKCDALQTRYEQQGQMSDLYAAAALYSQMFAAERAGRSFFPKKGGSEQPLKEANKTVESALATMLALRDATAEPRWADSAFAIVEQSRSMVLYSAMKSAQARQFGQVPDSLLAREYDLRVEIAWQEKRQHEAAEQIAKDRAAALAADASRAYETLKKRLETQYPQYYRLQYDLATVSPAELRQRVLDDSTSLLEYFVGDSAVYVIVLDKSRLEFRKIKRDFPLDDWANEMRHAISDPYTLRSPPSRYLSAIQYANAASNLYQKLVAPIAGLLRRKVVVVPDGVLAQVPFDALLCEVPKSPDHFGSHRYFGMKHQLSSGFSATLLREMQEKKHHTEPTGSVLAVAPFFRGTGQVPFSQLDTVFAVVMRDVISFLPHTGAEARNAAEILGGRVLLGAAAEKAAFMPLAERFRVLHLSTHGKADAQAGEFAYLAFTEKSDSTKFDKLFARDVYNLTLCADLVVLSACETGIGEVQRGEGIISLARAFTYAGAKSIVTTLWTVDDRSTEQLMALFYQNLRLGLPKDQALWKAKRDFIRAHPNTASPFFWAGFMVIGDMRPM